MRVWVSLFARLIEGVKMDGWIEERDDFEQVADNQDVHHTKTP